MKNKFILLVAVCIIALSCSKENTKEYNVEGSAQKGPFLIGTNVIISELNTDMKPTGSNFYATIENNFGNFSFPDVALASNYVQLRVDGGYYNEVGAYTTGDDITLYALVDLAKGGKTNVNLLTHICKQRIEYLAKKGESFATAKDKAEKELLAVLNMTSESSSSGFENSDITQSEEHDKQLLAASCIIMGELSNSALIPFLVKLSKDFEEDGTIDTEELREQLAANAHAIDPEKVRTNLKERYQKLGETVEVADFSSALHNYTSSDLFRSDISNLYPLDIDGKTNIFSLAQNTKLDTGKDYCLGVNFADGGTCELHIRIESIEGDAPIVTGELNNGAIAYDFSEEAPCVGSFPISFQGSGKIRVLMNWTKSATRENLRKTVYYEW